MAESVSITEEAYDDVIVNEKTRFTSLIRGLFNEIEQKNLEEEWHQNERIVEGQREYAEQTMEQPFEGDINGLCWERERYVKSCQIGESFEYVTSA